jgi:uncharacterized protein YjbI with pentapeptide repeats
VVLAACAALVAAAGVVAGAPVAAAASCPTVSPAGVVTPAPTQFVDWHGCDLRHAHLAGADLSVAKLMGANLTGADLSRGTFGLTDFTGADLTGTNLELADVNSATIAGATITGSRWASATVMRLRSGSLVGAPASLPDARFELVSGYVLGPWVDLTGADLHGVTVHTASLVNANLASTNLAGADLTGRVLSAEFTDADLSGATLVGADLSYALLTRTDLTNADASGAILDNAFFDHTTLTGANLGTARPTRIRSASVVGTPASLPAGWAVAHGYLVGPGANLKNTDFTGADLTGRDLRSVWLQGATLTGADLTGSNLTTASLTGSTVTGTVLSSVTLAHVATGGLVGVPAALPTGWLLRSGYLVGPGAALGSASLDGANLAGANLAGASLRSAHLAGADLTGTDLTGADLSRAILTGATVSGTDLTSATLLYVRASALVGTPSHLPSGWHLIGRTLIGPYADLTGLDLTGLDLSGLDLTGAVLASATVAGTTFTGATLAHVRSGGLIGMPANLPSPWLIVGGYLVGPSAELGLAHLDGLDLTKATLDHATLTSASLVGANLSGLDLTGVELSSATLTDANLAGVNLDGAAAAYAVLTRTDLTGAVAHSADLSRATLVGAKLGGADLSVSLLSSVRSGSITGVPLALPVGWHLVHGYLVGRLADLTDADLHGANLAGFDLVNVQVIRGNVAGADLHGADLSSSWWLGASLVGADLRGVNLTGSDISTSDLSRANLTGATGLASTVSYGVRWVGATCPDGKAAIVHRDATCLSPIDRTAPVAVALATPTFTMSRRFLVRWSASDDGAVAAVRYRITRSAAGSLTSAAPTTSTWLPASTTRRELVGAAGARYCWQVQARDRAGHLGRWSNTRCTTVPIDTRALHRTWAWTESPASAWFGGTVAMAGNPGATLSTPTSLAVRQVGVIASTCDVCGTLAVYVGRTRVGTISLHSTATIERRLLVLPRFAARHRGVVRLVVVSPLNRSLNVDALVVTAT